MGINFISVQFVSIHFTLFQFSSVFKIRGEFEVFQSVIRRAPIEIEGYDKILVLSLELGYCPLFCLYLKIKTSSC